ncbi:MAG: hypothetical protein ABEI99_10760 [Halobaculum sp.]
MSFTDWLAESRKRIATDGVTGLRESGYELYVGAWRQLGRRINYGRSVYADDWDVLVILDACRWDLMAEVVDEYDFVDDRWDYSVASSSGEFLTKTFGDHDTSETAYVTANPFSKPRLKRRSFAVLDEVWEYAVDEEVRTIPAAAVTDRAIRVARKRQPDDLVVHYMQPHYPFVPDPLDRGLPLHEFGQSPWDDVWDKLRAGELDRTTVWEGYRENLRYVLDSVATLLRNVDGDVLITADHGNLLGEFGLYGHPDFVPIPTLKRVPWCLTTATDEQTHEPDQWREDSVDSEREELLRDLGYA